MQGAERRLRERIQAILGQADKALAPRAARDIENEILALLREYSQAPDSRRDEVYARGEDRILHTLQKAIHP